jgi:2-oxoglutarate dehydrogenase complex dehydrogenase (E1) component-like enzyme
LEGSESTMVALNTLFRHLNIDGVTSIVLGMPHRCRLNLLVDFLKYPNRALFHKVKGWCVLQKLGDKLGDSHIPEYSTLIHNRKMISKSPRLAIQLAKRFNLHGPGRRRLQVDNVAIVRIEELCPFPTQQAMSILRKYDGTVYYAQEEPANQGAFNHVSIRLNSCLEELNLHKVKYIGRRAMVVPSTGVSKWFKPEQDAIVSAVFKVDS